MCFQHRSGVRRSRCEYHHSGYALTRRANISSSSAPTRNSRGPRKSTHTVNPSTLQNATTIALPSTTYCLTTLYLPRSPEFRPGTKTVWISTTTLYPEWDCHGCPSLTVVDPWAIGQPTSHYHHTKTSSSVLSVASPVCRPTQTSIDVILTAA
jgi:hypothetical protein